MRLWDDLSTSRLATALQRVRPFLPPINFITIHYAYFILVSLISSLIFWGSSVPAFSISYVDSLFLTVSAISEAGLNTVNLSQMTTWQQIILWLLIMLGSSIWVSIWTVLARKHAFEMRFEDVVREQRERRLRRRKTGALALSDLPLVQHFKSFQRTQTVSGSANAVADGTGVVAPVPEKSNRSTPSALPEANDPDVEAGIGPAEKGVAEDAITAPAGRIAFVETARPNGAGAGDGSQGTTTGSAYLHDSTLVRRHEALKALEPEKQENSDDHVDIHHFLYHRTQGRNAQFYNLSTRERETLGGCEYRALKVLAVVVPLYFVLWQLLGCIAVGAWINNYQPDAATGNGVNPWWAGIFNGVSAFNNSGMSLLDANMIPFERSYFVLITMGLLILAGNTAYPIFLRLIFWSCLKLLKLATPDTAFCDLKATLHFILTYPRRVYTNLFPARPTWWLLFMVVALNCLDWFSFLVLDIGNPATAAIPVGARVLDGLFQAVAVRSGGFYVIPIGSLYIGVQILYVIMMYVSAFPVVITMRHSNVYEERSLGIYSDDADDGEAAGERLAHAISATEHHFLNQLGSALHRQLTSFQGVGAGVRTSGSSNRPGESRIGFISQQIHGQLAHDIWMLVLAVLVISTIETSHFLADPVDYSVFNVIFEVVSAYGTVGISIGVPWAAYSFSGGWHAGSKLVLCLVMLRGRHRGLPVALDKAVRLPGENLHREEEEDHRRRRSMTERRLSLQV